MSAPVLETSIFDKSRPGAEGVSLPVSGVQSDWSLPDSLVRSQAPRLPEIAQLDAVRHFVRLSQLNHAIDKDFYPLGSCTMKYNPKICDVYGVLDGLTQLHPRTPASYAQGALAVMVTLQQYLADITGFDAVTLQPAAGAHGELVGMMMVRAYFESLGDTGRTEVLVPDSAHGTNPATAVMCGFDVVEIPSGADGLIDLEALRSAVGPKTAALMLTNPSTLGLFETDILAVTELVHQAGGLMYYDGANLNAVMGQAQPARMGFDVMHINTHKTFATPHGGGGPGSGPVAVTTKLAPFLPKPMAAYDEATETYYWDWDRPQSIGKVKAFWGNFEMMVRALTYILAYGAEGLTQVSRDAVMNANYLRAQLRGDYHVAFDRLCKHEFILTNQKQDAPDRHINSMAIVKRLMDYGFHPPTVYFPLMVREAMMIEPTETESKATLDRFVDAMRTIARECRETPEVVINAPHTTPIRKVDEVLAARKPDLNYYAGSPA
ncbi:MAG: aminomethyl-transferring glycine dehydrogenase subunit GcvPB [Candidatus Melainabacteria bacterium]